ncbi:MAG: heme-dependent oxidative N-demethylase family protein [Paracoccaceae bacterium]
MTAILQTALPFDPFAAPRLPGIAPLDPADWLHVDEAFAAQMAARARLLAARRDAVLRLDPAARPVAEELLDMVLDHLAAAPDYTVTQDEVLRPDGVRVRLDRDDPLGTAGLLVQEDLCLMEKRGDEHVLTGAVLCFPASWRLDEKFMRPLLGIHRPVAEYDADLARRVQRLFDGVRPGRPLWRFNALWYEDPSLHQPKSEADRRAHVRGEAPYLRSERQCVVRLPRTGAAVFSIHTYVLPRAAALATRGVRSEKTGEVGQGR